MSVSGYRLGEQAARYREVGSQEGSAGISGNEQTNKQASTFNCGWERMANLDSPENV